MLKYIKPNQKGYSQKLAIGLYDKDIEQLHALCSFYQTDQTKLIRMLLEYHYNEIKGGVNNA